MMIGVDKALHPTSAVQLDGHLRERKQLSTGLLGRRLTARVLQVPRGQFDAGAIVPDPDEWLGVLVLDGLIAAGVDAGRAHTTWLVGSDDLVRPWNMREFSLIQNQFSAEYGRASGGRVNLRPESYPRENVVAWDWLPC